MSALPKMRRLAKKVSDQVTLAQSYWDDGAPRSAARCLRSASDLAEIYAQAQDAAIASLAKVRP